MEAEKIQILGHATDKLRAPPCNAVRAMRANCERNGKQISALTLENKQKCESIGWNVNTLQAVSNTK